MIDDDGLGFEPDDDGLGFDPAEPEDEPEAHHYDVENNSRDRMAAVKALLAEGMTQSALSALFKVDRRRVAAAAANVTPKGRSRGYDTYDVAAIAPYLVAPPEEKMLEIITNLKPSQLPSNVSKDYWQAQLNRQKFMAQAGDLWRSERVQAVLASIFKTVRQQVLLFSDTVENQVGITEDQRKVINTMADNLLRDAGNAIREAFENYDEPFDHDTEDGPEEDDDGLS